MICLIFSGAQCSLQMRVCSEYKHLEIIHHCFCSKYTKHVKHENNYYEFEPC